MKHIERALLLAVSLAFSACGGGGGGGGTPASSSATLGSISGRVTADSGASFKTAPLFWSTRFAPAEGNVGVAGATVTLAGTQKSAVTDANGYFTINGVPPGTYILICTKTAIDDTTYSFLQTITVQNNATTSIGDVEVTPAGRITGRATLDGEADPTGIEVFIPGTSFQATTDAQGDYTFTDIPEGIYEIRFERTGYSPADLQDIEVITGETTFTDAVTLNLSTGPGGNVTLAGSATYINSRTVAVTVTPSADATLLQLSEDVNFVGSVWNVVTTSRTWVFASDGTKRLYVKFANANGLESSPVFDEIVVDTVAPTGSITANEGGEAVGTREIGLTLSATDAGSSVTQMRIGHDSSFTGAVWEAYATSHDWTLPEGDGAKTVYVQFMDGAGNVSETASDSVILDTQSPETTITAWPVNPSYTASATFMFSSDDPEATFEFQLDHGGFLACTSPKTVTVSGFGSHIFEVRAIDIAGNVDPTPAGATWAYEDGAPPAAPVITGTTPSSSGSTLTPMVNGTAEAGATVRIYTTADCEGTPAGTGTADESGNFSIQVTVTAYSSTTFYATAEDVSGNLSSASSGGGTFVNDADPGLTSFALSTTECAFTIMEGEGNPDPQTIGIANPSGLDSVLGWTVGSNVPWLHYSPYCGTTRTETDTLTLAPVLSQDEAWTTSTNASGAPVARENGSLVWTGSRMIVWGGSSGGASINSGALYDPASDTWTETTATADAPSGRWAHSAVWTGAEMIVWGGSTSGGLSNEGYRYDPVTRRWSGPISTTNAPSARRGHSAVWTGTEMIVWGGESSGGYVRSGGRYDPATDTWTAVNETGAPSARDAHMAVWTGTEMIVWGGYDGSARVQTGARYDPVDNIWTGTTTTTGAPGIRSVACAVWTGAEMIVWGGHDGSGGSNVLNTGGRYNPVADEWHTVTLSNAAAARRSHAAIWTGTEMIVWGGYNGTSSCFNTGKRYVPPVSLGVGTHEAVVTLTDPHASNSPQTIAISLAITASNKPALSVHTSSRNACESGPVAGAIVVTRTGATDNPVEFGYTITGSAGSSDYAETLTGTATIPALSSTVEIAITPVPDALDEPMETVVLTLQSSPAYTIAVNASSDSVSITDVPTPNDILGLNDSAWPTGGRNHGRTSLSPFPGPLTSHVNWTYSMGWGFGYFSITVDKDGTIYTGCWDNYLYAINPNGTLKWTYEGKGSLSAAIAADGKVLWGAPGGRLVALDPADGHEIWSLTTGDGHGLHPAPMIGRDGTIYLNLNDGAVAAVNADGTAKWRFETGSAITTPVAIGSDDTVYAANQTGTLYALNPNGTEKWHFQGAASCGVDLVVSDTNTIYYCSGGNLYSVDATGNQNWTYPTRADRGIAIGPNGDIVVKTGSDSAHGNGFACLHPNGTFVWFFSLGGSNILVKPAIGSNGMVYFAAWDSTIHAVDIADGTQEWSINTGGWIECQPAIGQNGVLYFGSNSGRLYAIQDQ